MRMCVTIEVMMSILRCCAGTRHFATVGNQTVRKKQRMWILYLLYPSQCRKTFFRNDEWYLSVRHSSRSDVSRPNSIISNEKDWGKRGAIESNRNNIRSQRNRVIEAICIEYPHSVEALDSRNRASTGPWHPWCHQTGRIHGNKMREAFLPNNWPFIERHATTDVRRLNIL